MSPRSREASDAARAAARARVLDAARTLFAEHGFPACRVADVARQAGMSPGNVYWHFESKDAILRAILEEGLESFASMTAEVAAEYGPARRKLGILVDRTIAFYDANAAFAVIVGGLAGKGGRAVVRSLGLDIDAIDGRCRANIRGVFAEGRSEGAIVSPADPDLLATLFLALFNGLVVDSRAAWSGIAHDVLRDAALRLVGYRPAGQGMA